MTTRRKSFDGIFPPRQGTSHRTSAPPFQFGKRRRLSCPVRAAGSRSDERKKRTEKPPNLRRFARYSQTSPFCPLWQILNAVALCSLETVLDIPGKVGYDKQRHCLSFGPSPRPVPPRSSDSRLARTGRPVITRERRKGALSCWILTPVSIKNCSTLWKITR